MHVCIVLVANSRVDDDEFLDMIASIQGSRMDDQRADAGALFPGLHSSPALIRQFAAGTHSVHSVSTEPSILDDDQFFETLMRCQVCAFGCLSSTLHASLFLADFYGFQPRFSLIKKVG